jgi:hypothetical protein
MMSDAASKIRPCHLQRTAIVYIRQSSASQVESNRGSAQRQYALAQRATALGWSEHQVCVVDDGLGLSGVSMARRRGFASMTAEGALRTLTRCGCAFGVRFFVAEIVRRSKGKW